MSIKKTIGKRRHVIRMIPVIAAIASLIARIIAVSTDMGKTVEECCMQGRSD